MTCHELSKRLSEMRPELSPCDIARLAVLILSTCPDPDILRDDDELNKAWSNASFRLDAAADQHAAVADELEALCNDGPIQFSPDQIWTLLRAVKVQSQLLDLYTDTPALT